METGGARAAEARMGRGEVGVWNLRERVSTGANSAGEEGRVEGSIKAAEDEVTTLLAATGGDAPFRWIRIVAASN